MGASDKASLRSLLPGEQLTLPSRPLPVLGLPPSTHDGVFHVRGEMALTSEKESKASKKFLEGKVQHWGRRDNKDPTFTSTALTAPKPQLPRPQAAKATSAGLPRGEKGTRGWNPEVGLAEALTDGALTTLESECCSLSHTLGHPQVQS